MVPITVIPTTIPPPPYFFNPLPQQATPTPTPTTSEATTSFPALLDFSSVFKFNDRVTKLETNLSEMKQVDHHIMQNVEKKLKLRNKISDFATPVIERNVTESLEAAVLAKSSSQTKSTYEAAASLLEKLYDALVESYNTNKDLFNTYGEVFSLKRSRDEKDKDQDPSAGSDRGTKRRKSSKEAESPKDQRSKEGKSSSSSNGTSRSHHKSSGKSAHAEEPSHTIDDSGVQQNQEFDTDLTQEILVGPAFNLLKGTCKSRTKLKYHFEECFKATTEQLDWHNHEGKSYPFDLRKPLPLIPDHRGRQVIPKDYFINNDLEYLKGGSLSRQYSTSVTKTKAATYEIKWIEDLVTNL
ncbi:hypothetical protein Tco_0511521 [Tanacetum coccineum]